MSGKRYFAAWGQQDAALGRKLSLRYMRAWPEWAFKAYAMAHIQQSMPRHRLAQPAEPAK